MKNKNILLRFKTVEEKQEYQRLILEIKGELPTRKSNHEIVIMALDFFESILKDAPESEKQKLCVEEIIKKWEA